MTKFELKEMKDFLVGCYSDSFCKAVLLLARTFLVDYIVDSFEEHSNAMVSVLHRLLNRLNSFLQNDRVVEISCLEEDKGKARKELIGLYSENSIFDFLDYVFEVEDRLVFLMNVIVTSHSDGSVSILEPCDCIYDY